MRPTIFPILFLGLAVVMIATSALTRAQNKKINPTAYEWKLLGVAWVLMVLAVLSFLFTN